MCAGILTVDRLALAQEEWTKIASAFIVVGIITNFNYNVG